ncbi:MAG: hypothetical protein KatS3mg002_0354 [Candidatus Woesearchaeota archaeon]|nr:MAG: hypothetical protein KatS3mg002_0354 [Candidatus Woesearchaeota archaeon]
MINKRLILFPQYPTKLRYQEWWLQFLPSEFEKYFSEVVVLNPTITNNESNNITNFSPVKSSIEFESKQIEEFLKLNPTRDDIVLILDVSFPGLVGNIIPHFLEVPFYGYVHATSINRYDYFSNSRIQKRKLEQGQINLFKKCFVSTYYHKNLLLDKLKVKKNKIKLIKGLPYNPIIDKYRTRSYTKKYEIISVSRNSKQKINKKLEKYVENFFGLKIERKKCSSWEEYYSFLGESKILLITSKDDTYGYAAMEAFQMGCIPIVPDNFAYEEIYPLTYKYESREDLIETIGKHISKWKDPREDQSVYDYAPSLSKWVMYLVMEMADG